MKHSPALMTPDIVVVLPAVNRPEAINGKEENPKGPVPASIFSSHYPELLIVLQSLYIPVYTQHARKVFSVNK